MAISLVAVWLLLATLYCFFHGAVAVGSPMALAPSVGWSLRNWGHWLILGPVMVYGVEHVSSAAAKGATVIAAVVLGLVIAQIVSWSFGTWANASVLQATYLRLPSHIALAMILYGGESLRSARGSAVKPPELIEVDAGGRSLLMKEQDIRWVAASGNYVELHDGQQCGRIRSTLNEFCDRLDSARFHRVHRSFLVNLDHVHSIERLPGTRRERVRMRDSERLVPVSRSGLAALRERLRSDR